jgi:hypothetical protein
MIVGIQSPRSTLVEMKPDEPDDNGLHQYSPARGYIQTPWADAISPSKIAATDSRYGGLQAHDAWANS